MRDAPRPGPSPRRTSYRALAEAVRLAVRADHKRLFYRDSQLKMHLERLEEAAQALEAMEPIHDSGDSFDRLGDVARRVVDGIGGKT
jgi:HAMP domain-containing protein